MSGCISQPSRTTEHAQTRIDSKSSRGGKQIKGEIHVRGKNLKCYRQPEIK